MLQIQKTKITRDGAPFVIAEIGVNHDGDPRIALQLITAAKKAGAHAVKFQLFDADLLLSNQALLVDYQKKSAKSATDLLRPLQLTPRQLAPLIKRAHALKLAAIITPFSIELVAPCKRSGADAIKLASPDLVNRPLLEEAVKTNLPLILSTGAADLPEIERTIGWLHHLGGGAIDRTILLHCVSSYPTPPNLATLAAIPILRNRFPELPIGYSDHTTLTLTAALAVAAGATVLEKHLTLNRKRKGPDHAASLEPKQFAEYVTLANTAHPMRGPYEKIVQKIEQPVRQQTRQSVVAKELLLAGSVLTREMLTVKRPGTGIPAAEMNSAIGKIVATVVNKNDLLRWEDLTDEARQHQEFFERTIHFIKRALRNLEIKANTEQEFCNNVCDILIDRYQRGHVDWPRALELIPQNMLGAFLERVVNHPKPWLVARGGPKPSPEQMKKWEASALLAHEELQRELTAFIEQNGASFETRP